jgi:hypothetical protein
MQGQKKTVLPPSEISKVEQKSSKNFMSSLFLFSCSWKIFHGHFSERMVFFFVFRKNLFQNLLLRLNMVISLENGMKMGFGNFL